MSALDNENTDYLTTWLINDDEDVYVAAQDLARAGDLRGLEEYVLSILNGPDEVSVDDVVQYAISILGNFEVEKPRKRSEAARVTRMNLSDPELDRIDWSEVASVLVSE